MCLFEYTLNSFQYIKKRYSYLEWVCGVGVSRLLCMQKAPGSNPGESIFINIKKYNHEQCASNNGQSLIDDGEP